MGHTRKPASFWRENVVAVGANVVVAKQNNADFSGAPNENIVQNHLNIANVF